MADQKILKTLVLGQVKKYEEKKTSNPSLNWDKHHGILCEYSCTLNKWTIVSKHIFFATFFTFKNFKNYVEPWNNYINN